MQKNCGLPVIASVDDDDDYDDHDHDDDDDHDHDDNDGGDDVEELWLASNSQRSAQKACGSLGEPR